MKETRHNDNNIKAFSAKYDKPLNAYFSLLKEEQLKDSTLWGLLVKQFEKKSDTVDNGWRGEFWGKLMRGASMVYEYSKDKELYAVMEKSVKDLLSTRDKFGRITTYTVESEFGGWDMWVRKYVMLGLEYFYSVCPDDKLKRSITDALESHADYIMGKVGDGDGKISIYDTSGAWGAINSVSIIQPFVRLYSITGKETYLSYAESLIRSKREGQENIFELAYRNEKAPYEYPVTKAYETISCFEGLLDYYIVTREEKCLAACVNFADSILENDFTLIGASGCRDEYFDNSTKKQLDRSDIHKQETCVTVTLMKFFAAMYACVGDVKYIEAVETSLWNAYLGALNDGENVGYLARPLFYSYSPIYDNPRWTLMGGCKNISAYAVFGCCVSIAAAGLGVLPAVGTVLSGGTVTVNFPYRGKYESENGIAFGIDTDYPYDGDIRISVEKADEPFIMRLRKPIRCGNFSLKKNGRAAEFSEKDGYIVLSEPVKAGDVLNCVAEMPLRVETCERFDRSRKDLFAVAKGPIVYCLDSKDGDEEIAYLPKTDGNGYAIGEKCGDNAYTVYMQDGVALKLTEYKSAGKNYYEPRDISVWLKRKGG